MNLLEQLLYHLPEFKDGSGLERKSDAKEQQKASSSSASEAKLPLRMKRQTDPTSTPLPSCSTCSLPAPDE